MIILLIVVNYSSSTVQQEQHVQHPTHRPTHPRTDYEQQQRGKGVQQQCMSSVMHTLLCCCILGFTCFYGPPLCRGSVAAPFDAPRPPLAEFGVGACSFAGDPEGCCVGRAWHGRAASGGRVALGRTVLKRGILKPTQMCRSKARRRSFMSRN